MFKILIFLISNFIKFSIAFFAHSWDWDGSLEQVASLSFSCASKPSFIALLMFLGSVASFSAWAAAVDEADLALVIMDWMKSSFFLMKGASTES